MRWWDRLAAWERSRAGWSDALGALLLWLLAAATAPFGGSGWALATIAPLAVRRRFPVGSTVAIYALVLAHLLTGLDGSFRLDAGDVMVVPALASVTLHGPRWAYRTAVLSAMAGVSLLGVVSWLSGVSAVDAAATTLVAGLIDLTAFAFALVRRSRREQLDALHERARRLELERDQQAVLATTAERARIAREMHDIVAHSLSVMILQADGGRYAADADPAAAVRSLTTIAETGRAALADMRKLLGVLRADQDDDGLELRPQPATGEIAELVEQVRGSGLAVSLVRMGEPRPLPPGTGLTVYRICQESLTNVLKHAGPQAKATVLVQWTPTSMVLEVSDDGRGAAAANDGAGQGLTGMRERAVMLGGTLTTGPRPGGGFRVRAELPVPPRRGAVRTPATTTEDGS